MSAEDWEGLREDQQKKKSQRREFNTGGILWMAGEMGLDVEEIAPYQFRITQGKKRLDYYPTSGKATWVGSGKFFKIKELDKFMEKHFK
jgi:hypothetical protein